MDASALNWLKGNRHDMFLLWRTAGLPTLTQRLGAAVLATGHFSAILYPSNVAEVRGKSGANFVIFQERVQPPEWE